MTDILWRELKEYWINMQRIVWPEKSEEEIFDEWSKYQIELIGEARDGKEKTD